MKLILATIIILCAIPIHAYAQVSGNEMYSTCRDATNNSLYCYGYLLGLWDGLITLENGAKTSLLCPPGKVNAQQLVLIFERYAEAHPAELSKYAGVLVTEAFMSAFPCQ